MTNIDELLRRSGLVHHEAPVTHTADGIPSVHLHAGRLLFTGAPTQITTILGSSVAICLWDEAAGVGGMNHYILPGNQAKTGPVERFADTATKALVDGLLSLGAEAARLRARVFGGASVLGHAVGALGENNVLAAQWQLASHHIPIVSKDVGGLKGRKIVFRTDTGSCTVKTV